MNGKNRGDGIEPMPNGTYRFRVDLPRGPDGRRRQVTRRGFKTIKEAKAERAKIVASAESKTYVAPKRQTLEDYLIRAWLPAKEPTLALVTWQGYERHLRIHICPQIGRFQLQHIDGVVLNRFYSHLLKCGRQRGQQSPGLKPRTVKAIHQTLHKAFDDAVRWRLLSINPADQADPPSAAQAKAPEFEVWSASQVDLFLRLVRNDRYYWPWFVLLTTGARRSEILAIRWQDVDFDRGLISIRQKLIPVTKPGGVGREGVIFPRTKNDKARVIELDSPTIRALRQWKKLHAEERLAMGGGYTDLGLVFARPDGRPYHPENFSKEFDRRLRRKAFAELPRIRLHDTRHTWATLALIAGVDIKIVAERLGHSSPMVTWHTYQHVIKGMQAEAAEKVAAMIFRGGA